MEYLWTYSTVQLQGLLNSKLCTRTMISLSANQFLDGQISTSFLGPTLSSISPSCRCGNSSHTATYSTSSELFHLYQPFA